MEDVARKILYELLYLIGFRSPTSAERQAEVAQQLSPCVDEKLVGESALQDSGQHDQGPGHCVESGQVDLLLKQDTDENDPRTARTGS